MSNDLRSLVREGDPLPPGESLTPAAVARMRQSVMAEAARQTSWHRWPLAAMAAVVVTVAAALLLLNLVPPTAVDPLGERAAADPPGSLTRLAETPPDRQVRFTTRGGTRVIWMLKPTSPAP